MSIAPITVPMGFDDPGRNNKCWPTAPVAAANFNRDRLKCYYRCMLYCAPDDLVSRTFLDIYPNGIFSNVPCGYCCCMTCDSARFFYYDDPRLFRADPVGGGCCKPFCFCCPHCFNLCGNVLVFRPGYIGCPAGAFHGTATLCPCVCPIDILCGLDDGEGDRIASKIKEQKTIFEKAGNSVPKPIQIAPGGLPQMNQGGHGYLPESSML